MPPDIRSGDVLVVGAEEYPVRSAAVWSMEPRHLAAFRRLARLTAGTKRSPDMVGGQRGAPAVHLTDLRCTPLDPVEPDLQQRMGLDTPHTLLQSYVADSTGYVHLVVEDLRR